jgi:hypothetical protein
MVALRWKTGERAGRIPRDRPPRMRRRRHGGYALLELAVVSPLLFLTLLGTIDIGRMFFDFIEMRGAVNEAVTYGSRRPLDTTGIIQQARDHGMPDDANVTVTTTGSCNTVGGVGEIEVMAVRTFTPISVDVMDVVGGDVEWSLDVTAVAKMRCMT